jgi:hypothetical protein
MPFVIDRGNISNNSSKETVSIEITTVYNREVYKVLCYATGLSKKKFLNDIYEKLFNGDWSDRKIGDVIVSSNEKYGDASKTKLGQKMFVTRNKEHIIIANKNTGKLNFEITKI